MLLGMGTSTGKDIDEGVVVDMRVVVDVDVDRDADMDMNVDVGIDVYGYQGLRVCYIFN